MRWNDDKLGLALFLVPPIAGVVQMGLLLVLVVAAGPSTSPIAAFGAAVLMVVATIVLATMDARRRGRETPMLLIFMWIVGYPLFMRDRARQGYFFGAGWGFIAIAGFFAPLLLVAVAGSMLSGRRPTTPESPSFTMPLPTLTASPPHPSAVASSPCKGSTCTVVRITDDIVASSVPITAITFTAASTQGDVATITRLPHVTSVTILSRQPSIDLAELAELRQLEFLDVSGSDTTSLAPLAGLPLHTLRLADRRSHSAGEIPEGAYLHALDGLDKLDKLTTLDLTEAHLPSLAPVAHLTSLTNLELDGEAVASLLPIEGLTSLEVLFVEHDPALKDLSPVAKLRKLKSISLSSTGVVDLGPLATLPALEQLTLLDTTPKTLAPLAKISTLKKLSMSKDLPDAEVAELAALHKALPALKITRN